MMYLKVYPNVLGYQKNYMMSNLIKIIYQRLLKIIRFIMVTLLKNIKHNN
nr:MAG TPA: hypothetical protein [Caudoviricetes sp.]